MHFFLIAAAIVAIAPIQPSQPNRQPQLAAAPGLTALVFGSQNSILFSASHDDARSFSTPIEVAKLSMLMLGRHRGPRVVIAGDTIVISAVDGTTAPPHDPRPQNQPGSGNLFAWRSTNGGKTWSQPVTVNDVQASAREGLHAMAVGQDGEIAAVWLDLRKKARACTAPTHETAVRPGRRTRCSMNRPMAQSANAAIRQSLPLAITISK
jgi:hypothetical protein